MTLDVTTGYVGLAIVLHATSIYMAWSAPARTLRAIESGKHDDVVAGLLMRAVPKAAGRIVEHILARFLTGEDEKEKEDKPLV